MLDQPDQLPRPAMVVVLEPGRLRPARPDQAGLGKRKDRRGEQEHDHDDRSAIASKPRMRRGEQRSGHVLSTGRFTLGSVGSGPAARAVTGQAVVAGQEMLLAPFHQGRLVAILVVHPEQVQQAVDDQQLDLGVEADTVFEALRAATAGQTTTSPKRKVSPPRRSVAPGPVPPSSGTRPAGFGLVVDRERQARRSVLARPRTARCSSAMAASSMNSSDTSTSPFSDCASSTARARSTEALDVDRVVCLARLRRRRQRPSERAGPPLRPRVPAAEPVAPLVPPAAPVPAPAAARRRPRS